MAAVSGNVMGNWPSYVHLKVRASKGVRAVVKRGLENAAEEDKVEKMGDAGCGGEEGGFTGAEFVCKKELHISLSRQFYLRTHHIDAFVQELGLALGTAPIVPLRIDSKHFTLSNDDASRRFLCIPVHDATGGLRRLTDATSATLTRFRQPAYYENPIFHISIAEAPAVLEAGTSFMRGDSSRADVFTNEEDDDDDDDDGEGQEETADGQLESHVRAATVSCTIGNRNFRLDLGGGGGFQEERNT